ncbi:hypothetical protein CALCODRAFT_361100 [Calocera cornea HHB12733]|uniref:F-box domain-containing protein n=1 Tax=Calocera cornea HHB12733 TaxID=1353952 RepID=A0A165EKY5_9BASI|nr:hypothetical protein CALCODRAFT_361100 [Calocera cornea HHB12733]
MACVKSQKGPHRFRETPNDAGQCRVWNFILTLRPRDRLPYNHSQSCVANVFHLQVLRHLLLPLFLSSLPSRFDLHNTADLSLIRRTTMHHLWRVEDVVRYLLRFVEHGADLALGLTCRSLFELAMDDVWFELNTGLERLSPFLKGNEGPDSHHIDEESTSVAEADMLGRLNTYVRRIKRLKLHEYLDNDDLTSFISKVGSIHLRQMFSGLHTLTINASHPPFLLNAIGLGSSQLPELQVYIQIDCEEELAEVPDASKGDTLGAFLEPLLRPDRLDHLRISGAYSEFWTREAKSLEIFTERICQARPELSDLQIGHFAYGPRTVTALSTLSNLKGLTLSVAAGEFITPVELPVLDTLRVRAQHADSFVHFLENLECPLLTTLNLESSPSPSPIQWHNATTRIMANNYPHLKNVIFICSRGVVIEYPFDWFDALLDCHEMAVMTVVNQGATPATITDDNLYKIARNWPQLETFDFGHMNYHGRPSPLSVRATLLGLSELAKHCPRLTRLALRGSLANSDSILSSGRQTCSSPLSELSLFECPPPPGVPEAAASALKACFPYLRSLQVNNGSCNQWGKQKTPLPVIDITRMLGSVFRTVRRGSIGSIANRSARQATGL